MPKLRHFDHLGTARFITFSCYHRRQLLTDGEVIRILLVELDSLTHHASLRLPAHVIMPEHVHLAAGPGDWPWSSHRWYQGEDTVLPPMDNWPGALHGRRRYTHGHVEVL